MRTVRYVAAVDVDTAKELAWADIRGTSNAIFWPVALHPNDIVKSELLPGRMIYRVLLNLEPAGPLWHVVHIATCVPRMPGRVGAPA